MEENNKKTLNLSDITGGIDNTIKEDIPPITETENNIKEAITMPEPQLVNEIKPEMQTEEQTIEKSEEDINIEKTILSKEISLFKRATE